MRLVLVGAGHVFDLEAALRPLILRERPTVVALELDPERFHGLQQRREGRPPDPASRRRAGLVYRYLVRFQESVGESFGVQPGTEMLVAADAARDAGAQIALIDRDAHQVVKEALGRMTFREKIRLITSSVAGVFASRRRRALEQELHRYQSNPEAYLDELGRQFPTIRKVLIDERDDHMAARIRTLARTHPNVVAVVGDGHVPGLARRLADLQPIVHRLKDLREGRPSAAVHWRTQGAGHVGFSFDAESPESALRRGAD